MKLLLCLLILVVIAGVAYSAASVGDPGAYPCKTDYECQRLFHPWCFCNQQFHVCECPYGETVNTKE